MKQFWFRRDGKSAFKGFIKLRLKFYTSFDIPETELIE